MATYVAGRRGRPRGLPRPPQRLPRQPRAAGGPDHRQRREVGRPPAGAARHPGGRARRHQRAAGLGRPGRPPPQPAGRHDQPGRGDRAHDDRRRAHAGLRRRRLPGAAGDREPAGRRGHPRRRARGRRPAHHRRPGARGRRGGVVGERAARAGRARRVAQPADGGRGARAAGADQPALHLQLARRDRQLRAYGPRPRPRAAAGVRRLHPLLLPPPRGVHDARRGAALRRALPPARAGPLRRPAPGDAARSRPRCCRWRCRSCASSRWWRTPYATGSRPAPTEDGVGRLSITARDLDQECIIEVEDDGAGEDPERVRQALAGDASMDSVGLGNVDARLRNAYGDDYGLVVETAPGAGTKVIVRVPKFAPGVQV